MFRACPDAGPTGRRARRPGGPATLERQRILVRMLRRAATIGGLGLAVTCAAATAQTGDAAAARAGDALYVCADPGDDRTVDVGAAICDAAPTDALTRRLEPDNLQLRQGALVTGVSAGGIAQAAGLRAGDVIYRVGGVDVEDEIETTARLSLIGDRADTVVNFLRGGRPYLVKLRRP